MRQLNKICFLILLIPFTLNSQVLITTNTGKEKPHPNSILELDASRGALILPVIEKDSLDYIKQNNPVKGMILFDNTKNQFIGFDGRSWVVFGGENSTEKEASPSEGEVIFTEFMIDPEGDERFKEWFEVYNTTNRNLNLAKCVFSNNEYVFQINGNLIISANDFLVFGAIEDKEKNGEIPVDYTYGYSNTTSNFNFTNGTTSNTNNIALECNKVLVDEVKNLSLSGKFPISEGATTSLKPDYFDSKANDLPQNYYASGNPTPKMMNITPPVLDDNAIRINEFHYKNKGSAKNEFVEIRVKKGSDVSAVNIYHYNGSDGKIIKENGLSNMVKTADASYDYYVWETPIQDGPDGFALVNANEVIEFLTYGGAFKATIGPASGMTSRLIPLEENSSTPPTASISRTKDNQWQVTDPNTRGQANF